MHYLYIIYSESLDKYYIGESTDAINRLDQHNPHYFQGTFTKAAKDWKIVRSMVCDHREDALFLERFIKRMKSKKFIRKIIEDESILPWTKELYF